MTLSNDYMVTIQISQSADVEQCPYHKLSGGLSCSLQPVLELSSVHLTMSVFRPPLSTDDLKQPQRPFSQADTFDILDAGIRNAITANTTRSVKGVRLAGSESFKNLADIAPSIWSPGYRAAMSSRSLLLPTISHALSRAGIGNTKSITLRSKFSEVNITTHAYSDSS